MSQVNSFLQQLSYRHKQQLVSIGLLSLMTALAEVIPVFVIIELMRRALENEPLEQYLWLLLAAFVLKLLLTSAAYGLSHMTAYRLIYELRCKLLKHIQSLPLESLQKIPAAVLKQRIIQDVEQLETSIAHHLVEAIIAVFFPIFLLYGLYQLHPALLLATVIPLSFAAYKMYSLSQLFNSDQLVFSGIVAKLNGSIDAFLRCLPMMRVYQKDSQNFKLFTQQQLAYNEQIGKIIPKTTLNWAIFSSSVAASVFMISVVGYWLLNQGQLTTTDYYLSIFVGMSLLRPILKITRLSSEANIVVQCWQRLTPWLKVLPINSISQALSSSSNNAIQVIDASYWLNGKLLLQRISLDIPRCNTTLIIGPSGAGKTLLLELLAGLRRPSTGSVRHLPSSSLPVLVEQKAHIFNASLRDNLTLGCYQSDSEIHRALKVVQLDYLCQFLANGLDTFLTFSGNDLSGGERQRLAIARGLLSGSPILLLDEAVAFLDEHTKKELLQALISNYADKALVFVSHCLLPTVFVDQVIVLEDGQISYQGEHNSPLINNRYFSRYQQQEKRSPGERSDVK